MPIGNNLDPFATNYLNCRYHTLESRNEADQPRTSLRVREPANMKSPGTQYLQYSVPHSKDALDLSFDYPENSTVWPNNIYKKGVFAYSPSSLIIPRDKNYLYTYSPNPDDGKERTMHTLTASRFGYDRFPNEYGLGHFSKGFIEPVDCSSYSMLDFPKNMAPERFYSDYHLFWTPTEFRKMNDSRKPIHI
jgi:hypothetical protein